MIFLWTFYSLKKINDPGLIVQLSNGCRKFSLSITGFFFIYIEIENNFKKGIFHNITQHFIFYCIYDQINATLVSIRNFFQKH